MQLLKRNFNDKYYYNEIMVLDTETSHTRDNSVCWVCSIQVLFLGNYYLFRKPSEFIEFLQNLTSEYELTPNKQIVCYIHNASYDMEYLRPWLYKYIGKAEGEEMTELFTGSHKMLYECFQGFEFRCSYRLSGKSLEQWGEDLNVEHKKKSGTYDYDKIIYQDSILTETEQEYMKYDVLSLYECLQKQFELYDDNITTVPYTKTGYVRRDIKKRYKCNGIGNKKLKKKLSAKNREKFRKRKPTVEVYKTMNELKNGAITHGNRFYRNKKIVVPQGKKGFHIDLCSAYPSVICAYRFPCSEWVQKPIHKIETILKMTNDFAFMVKIRFKDVKLKQGVTLPFMQTYKAYNGRCEGWRHLDDNGRILMTEGQHVMVVSDLMLAIIYEQYDFEYCIEEVYASYKDYLPNYIVDTTKKYFYDKTKFKKILKQYEKEYGENHEKTIQANVELIQSKSLINAVFGCLYEDICKDSFSLDTMLFEFIKDNKHKSDEEIQAQIDKHYKSHMKWSEMQFGWYTTELVKKQIYDAVKIIGYDNFIYSDTDSIYFLGESEKIINDINIELRKIADDTNAYIEYEGNREYLNYFDFEQNFKEFKFLHSKCYAYTTEHDEFITVIAGVCKTNGLKQNNPNYQSREMELLNIVGYKNFEKIKDFSKAYDNFSNGFIFKNCGGTTSKYVQHEVATVDIDGHSTEVANGNIIVSVNKELKSIQSDEEVFNYFMGVIKNERKR